MLRGEYSVTVGGKERHFKMCLLAENLFSQYEGIKLSEHRERLLNPIHFTQVHLILSHAMAYAKINKLPTDFTEVDVCEWIDEVGEDVFIEKIMKIADAQLGKNVPAPEETGRQPGSGTTV
jgi:hypothetical protein